MRVLVTGAAGLVGGELCGALTGRGHSVTAVVHRSRRIGRADGTAVATAPGPAPGRVVVVEGDVTRPDLGWGDAEAADRRAHDIVVHCAADTALRGDAVRQHGTNVGGTRHLLRWLAGGSPAPGLVHVSTAYVCGARSGAVDEVRHAAPSFNNAYEAGKAEAEALVAASGLPAVVARPSIVVGRWADGALSRFDTIYGVIRLAGEGRLRVLPAAAGATLDLVPIDHVVGGLVDLVERFDAAAGGIVHLASGAPVPVAALCALNVPGFRMPRLVPPDAGERRSDFIALFAGYLAQDPRFRTDALAALSGRRCPPTDDAFLHRLVDGACRAGFLRPDPALLREPATLT